jgi:hypothetical protein
LLDRATTHDFAKDALQHCELVGFDAGRELNMSIEHGAEDRAANKI